MRTDHLTRTVGGNLLLAVYVSTLPLSVTFSSSGGFDGLLFKSRPERLVIIAVAIVLRGCYWRMSRRVHVAGL